MTDKIAAAFGIDPSTIERTPTDSKSREAFELWASDCGEYPRAITRSGDGYLLNTTQLHWNAWQAAHADITERQARLVEKVATMTLSTYALKTIAAMIREGTFTCD